MAQTYDDGYGHNVVAKEDLQISRSTSAKTGGKIDANALNAAAMRVTNLIPTA